MQRYQRGARTVLVGVLLGLLLPFAYVALAQRAVGEPLPLVTALQAVGVAADVDLVIAEVPAVDVYLPQRAGDWRAVLEGLAGAYGLTVCELAPGTLLVSGAPAALGLCAQPAEGEAARAVAPVVEVVTLEAAELPGDDGAAVDEPAPEYEYYDIRLRVIEISETAGIAAGFDWNGAVFDTVLAVVAGDYATAARRLGSGDVTAALRLLESEGFGRRLDDLRVRARTGVPAVFRSGGDVAVNLVGGGNENISRTYAFGLALTVTPQAATDAGVPLTVDIDASAPVNVSSAELLTLSRRSVTSEVTLACGEAAVLGSLYRLAEDLAGQGLPGLSGLPYAGYAFGSTGQNRTASSLVLTLELACVGA